MRALCGYLAAVHDYYDIRVLHGSDALGYEYLGGAATAENVLNEVQQLTIPAVRNKMIEELKSADKIWYRKGGAPAKLIAESLRKEIKQN